MFDDDSRTQERATLQGGGNWQPYNPIRELLADGHGFRVEKAPGPNRSDRRRPRYARESCWVIEHRPDVFTPVQVEALWLFHADSMERRLGFIDDAVLSYCVDEQGRSIKFPISQDDRPLDVWALENGIDHETVTPLDLKRAGIAAADQAWQERRDLARDRWHQTHKHLAGPLSISQAARYLGVSVGAFRDRLRRAERRAVEAWNYDALRRGEKPIPDFLTKYRRRRVKKGRAVEKS